MLETSAFSLFTVSNLQNQHDNTKLPCYTLLPTAPQFLSKLAPFILALLPMFLIMGLDKGSAQN